MKNAAVGAARLTARAIVAVAIAGWLAACATRPLVTRPAPPAIPSATMLGVASWYGPGFSGHRTSSGAVYDQNAMTAASTLFPLGTRLRVTNLDNGRAVDVVVNDHGPYVKGRGLDVSHQAAKKLGMLGRGTAPVRMEVLETPAGGPALGQRYFIQVASFADRRSAWMMSDRLAATYTNVHVIEAEADGHRRYRVRLGAYFDRADAERHVAGLMRAGYAPRLVTE